MFLSDSTLRHLQQVASWPDLTGTRYTLVRELGRGGMGTVYLARDHSLDRDVALKVVNTAGPHPVLDGRLRSEARVLARLEHPGIVPVHDSGTLADGRTFYVMKLVRGAQLLDHLAGVERLDERLRIFERICEPVAFAHAQGVVHRDLKPANVMVGGFGEVLVLDWGLSKAVGTVPPDEPAVAVPGDVPEGATQSGTVIGTPGYMAPEQQAGRAVDQRADVHALGALLVTMLTGTADPPPANDARLRAAGVPARLRAICRKAMAADPGARYADAAALADDVARFRAGLPVSAHRETPVERAARILWAYRTPILIVLAYLVMRALVAWYTADAGR